MYLKISNYERRTWFCSLQKCDEVANLLFQVGQGVNYGLNFDSLAS
jgi:hypothetical protein